jgi:hypothetical protein
VNEWAMFAGGFVAGATVLNLAWMWTVTRTFRGL